jgi:predicted nucleic acid-binding protein
MMIIANATPLIYLHRIGQLELLHQLFTQVTIPEAVARELQMGLITTVKAPLDAMIAAGLWIAPALYEQVLHKLGEL